jgi:FixJ family two-component response regulator
MTSAAACPKIFVVDDDEAVRDSIKVLLEVHGLDVEDFGSTSERANTESPSKAA